jgi:hypothetical protein
VSVSVSGSEKCVRERVFCVEICVLFRCLPCWNGNWRLGRRMRRMMECCWMRCRRLTRRGSGKEVVMKLVMWMERMELGNRRSFLEKEERRRI